MADEKDQQKGRQLKIKGMDGEETTEKSSKKTEKKEKESKWWVLLIFLLTVVISLLFSAKAENGWISQLGKRKVRPVERVEQGTGATERNKVESSSERGWFGPAVYEFE